MRRRIAPALQLLGAGLLTASLFLDWFELSFEESAFTFTGWAVFETADVLLVSVTLIVLARLLLRWRGLEHWPRWLIPGTGAFAVILVVSQAVEPPPLLSFAEGQLSREVGLWLALGASVAVFVGGLLELVVQQPRMSASRG